jgi:hypothetical protein
MGFTSNDASHLFFGVPVLAYAYLIALDTYGALGKGRKLPKSAEFNFLIGFGFIILIVDIFGYKGCPEVGKMMCQDINMMHILFGLFIMAAGAIGLMHIYINMFGEGVMWMTPLTLSVVGMFMTQHSQEAEYGTFVHKAFGYSSLFTSLLRAATLYDPQKWSIFLAWSASTTALIFVTGSDSMEDILSPKFMPHTVVLGVCCIAVISLIPLMTFIHYMTKGKKRNYTSVKIEKINNEDSGSENSSSNDMPLTNRNYGF